MSFFRETGEGGCSPLPVSPTPSGDIPTVHSMGRSRKRTESQLAPGTRLPTGYRHDCPRPSGRGRSAKRGRGGGYKGRILRNRDRGRWRPPFEELRLPSAPFGCSNSGSSHLRCSRSCRDGSRAPNRRTPRQPLKELRSSHAPALRPVALPNCDIRWKAVEGQVIDRIFQVLDS